VPAAIREYVFDFPIPVRSLTSDGLSRSFSIGSLCVHCVLSFVRC
jgi:hypothetical protein